MATIEVRGARVWATVCAVVLALSMLVLIAWSGNSGGEKFSEVDILVD